jgi:immune inhibitor A
MQAEDAGVGVISHEYGHDLGLPDLYDTSGAGESDVDFWDLMSSGSHTGPLFQTIPTHMGLWDKYMLGWVDPETFGVGSSGRDVKVGQTSRTPRGTEDGIRVNLPSKTVTRATPHSGENMWYSNNDQPWADVKLSRTLEVPAGADVRFWTWNNYTIEELWDYGFIEVSTDGGATWSQLEVRDEAGNVVSTSEDPNGRLRDYGGLVNGLTGTTGGEWRHDWVNLTPYAGTTIGLRLRYATDAAFEEPGWFADDFEVTADGTSVFTDDVEGGDAGWTSEQGTFTTPRAPAGSSPAAPSSTSTTTWPSGATTTASTRACATPTTPPTPTASSGTRGRSPAPPTTPRACWSGIATPTTP